MFNPTGGPGPLHPWGVVTKLLRLSRTQTGCKPWWCPKIPVLTDVIIVVTPSHDRPTESHV